MEQEEEDIKAHLPSYIESDRKRSKENFTEIEKDKSPQTKTRWDNLRYAGLTKTKLRLVIYMNDSVCDLFVGSLKKAKKVKWVKQQKP